jgi:large subunit ribosomal protein L35
MPKMKTHKGTAKRVHVTGTGKLMVRYMNPKRLKRSSSKIQQIRRNRPVDSTVARTLRKNLPYAKVRITTPNES